MPRTRPTAALALTLVGVALAAPAQPPAKSPLDPQAKFEPKSNPGAGQKYLAAFAGEWAVEKAFYPAKGGDPARSKGTCTQELVHGGRFLKSEFAFGEGDRKTTGTGTIGFEPETNLFTSSWIDSRQTRMSFRRSESPFDGKQIVLFGADLGAEKPARRSKTVTTIDEGGAKIVHRQYAVPVEGPERLVMELAMTRRGGAGK